MTDLNKRLLQTIKDDLQGETMAEEDATAIGLIRASFKGTFRYTMIFIVVFQLILAALGVYCAYEMLGTDLASDKINWLAGLLMAVLAFLVARLWFFMELNRLSLLREIKRVELLLSLQADSTKTTSKL